MRTNYLRNCATLIVVALMMINVSFAKTTIKEEVQTRTTELLKAFLQRNDGLAGYVLIMDVHSGAVEAMAGLEKDGKQFVPKKDYLMNGVTPLARTATLLSVLEAGKVNLTDTMDTGSGLLDFNGRMLRDHIWRRGGFGQISLEDGFIHISDIALYKAVEKTYGNNRKAFFDALESMSYGKPNAVEGQTDVTPADLAIQKAELFPWTVQGYNQKISPLQVLAFYNAIANGGVMLQPQLNEGGPIVINKSIAKEENLAKLKSVLSKFVTVIPTFAHDSFAGYSSIIETYKAGKKNGYKSEFCGYFPTEKPQYTILVSISKRGMPISRKTSADLVQEISAYLVSSK